VETETFRIVFFAASPVAVDVSDVAGLLEPLVCPIVARFRYWSVVWLHCKRFQAVTDEVLQPLRVCST